MKNIKPLINRLNEFADLEYNWNSYNSETISKISIDIAINIVNIFIVYMDENVQINVFPMNDGGIQFEIDNYIEIEIDINGKLKIILFDIDSNIIKEF